MNQEWNPDMKYYTKEGKLYKQKCHICGKVWEPESLEEFYNHSVECSQDSIIPKKKSKYHNEPAVYRGFRFDSKLEARYCAYLDNLIKEIGDYILYYTRQVPFQLPGNITYRCDFMVVRDFGEGKEIEYIDCKGVETPTFKLKKKLVEAHYPVEIKIVKKGGF